ncbi:MAG: iron-containing redox enzyme family protein [Gemmatimonadaceae bacterium]
MTTIISDPDVNGSADHTRTAPIVTWLEQRVTDLLARIQQEEFWIAVTSDNSQPELVQAIMREVYLDICAYQPHVIEAAIASIAQMPRSMNPRLIRSMLYHQADEWDHGEMALRDYVNMGGDAIHARHLPMSPESFAVAGVWWMIAHMRDPFAYIGALYLFEGLTPVVTGLVMERLRVHGMRDGQLEYVEFHSTEDIKHARLVNHMIAETVTGFPEALESVRRGYEYFEAAYPIPLWRAAYERAVASHGQVYR